MNTSLFSNMFKSLFGEQITPTAQQFVPITASDGTPAGISSMPDFASMLGAIGLTPNKYVDSSITSLTSLGIGIFGVDNASRISDIPTVYGTHAVLIFRFVAAYPQKGTMLVDLEGTVGIYTRYSESATFNKQ